MWMCLSVGVFSEEIGTKPICERRGLGEMVRAGVVIPVSQVSSAVDARLTLLVMDRRRPDSLKIERGSTESSSEWL